ncbi:hypothetical protein QBC34DRAFT_412917 [Podospora aff. communis PSN243]|uniref:MYND-type domain-containing protein n=1 Tax=Podospora aff. communis PSN243 TaxID=3040156 RepID=A0AAV9GBX9_9PEZI|nr:hypothetical protein QBC34DRAFT_412917 [Podospora aff. communis PSN243]
MEDCLVITLLHERLCPTALPLLLSQSSTTTTEKLAVMAPNKKKIVCSCGRHFGTNAAMKEHRQNSHLHSSEHEANTAAEASNTNKKQQHVANLRDKSIFPDFSNLPHEYDIDEDFFRTTNGFHYTPRKHWCFMAEIEFIEEFIRLRLIVKSRGTRVPIAFHTDDRGAFVGLQAQVGYTAAVLYAYQHPFLDMTTGIRVEDDTFVTIIPAKHSDLLALSDRVGKYSLQGAEMTCHGCDEHKPGASLMKCSRCSMFWYCNKDCQTRGWVGKGHKGDCKMIRDCGLRAMFMLDWNRYDDDVMFPLPEPK